MAWLAGINVLLAIFNVLPAAPLDGGRLLRAAVWKATGDRTRASVVAARAGWVLGVLLIGLGLWQFLSGVGFGGLWLALIGWFLIGAAGMEERQARTGSALRGIRVGDVMTPQPQTASAEMTVADFVDHYLFAYRHSALPLTEDGRPIGLVTVDRVRGVPPERRASTTLAEVACRADELVLAQPGEQLNDLLPRLSECADGRALVVTEDGRLTGHRLPQRHQPSRPEQHPPHPRTLPLIMKLAARHADIHVANFMIDGVKRGSAGSGRGQRGK